MDAYQNVAPRAGNPFTVSLYTIYTYCTRRAALQHMHFLACQVIRRYWQNIYITYVQMFSVFLRSCICTLCIVLSLSLITLHSAGHRMRSRYLDLLVFLMYHLLAGNWLFSSLMLAYVCNSLGFPTQLRTKA